MASSAFYEVGRYRCRLGKHAVIEKPKGPQLVLKFQIEGVYGKDGQVHDVANYERTYYRTFNENTMEFAIADLKLLGFAAAKFTALDPDSDDPFSFDGIDCDMFCKHEASQDGGTKESWGPARQGGSSDIEGKRVEKSALRKLDTLFGKALQGNAKKAPQPAATLTQEAVGDDDVPF